MSGTESADQGRRPPGRLESAVLDVLWQAGRPLTPAAVRDRLADAEPGTGPLSYSTVVTILGRLYAKGVLVRARHGGRAYAYQPVADEPGLTARRMHQLLAARPTDRDAVLTRFVSDLSDSDERLLRHLLATDVDPTG